MEDKGDFEDKFTWDDKTNERLITVDIHKIEEDSAGHTLDYRVIIINATLLHVQFS